MEVRQKMIWELLPILALDYLVCMGFYGILQVIYWLHRHNWMIDYHE